MIRGLILVAALGLSSTAFAKNTVGGLLSLGHGGLSLGGSFEHEMDKGVDIGGYVRMFSKDRDRGQDGYMTFGGNARIHAGMHGWDFSLAPGVGVLSIDSSRAGGDDVTTLAPSLGIAMLYQLNNNISLGVENYRYYAWLDDDARGLVIDDLAIKVTGSF